MKNLLLIFLLLPSLATADGGSCQGLFTGPFEPIRFETENDFINKSHEFNSIADINTVVYPAREAVALDNRIRNGLVRSSLTSRDLVDYRKRHSAQLSKEQKENLKDRHFHLTMGSLLVASEVLSHRNIEHVITRSDDFFPHIVISTEGTNHFNRLAARLKAKYNLEITVDPFMMSFSDSAGMYMNSRKPTEAPNKLVLGVQILAETSLLQNATVLHELTHALNYNKANYSNFKPYHVRVEVNRPTHESEGGYNQFSVDEFLAYRTTIRSFAHNARTSKDSVDFNYWYKIMRNRVNLQISLSSTTLEAIKEIRSLNGESHPMYKIKNYNGTLKTESFDSLERIANYNKALYEVIESQFKVYENRSEIEKRKLLSRLISILSMPAIKKMDGDLPSMDQVHAILNQ